MKSFGLKTWSKLFTPPSNYVTWPLSVTQIFRFFPKAALFHIVRLTECEKKKQWIWKNLDNYDE